MYNVLPRYKVPFQVIIEDSNTNDSEPQGQGIGGGGGGGVKHVQKQLHGKV